MSMEHVYKMAEQPIHHLSQVCHDHEIVLSRRVLCRALAMQIAEELDPGFQIPEEFETMAIPSLLAWMDEHHLMLDLYALKLKVWMVLYTNRDALHINSYFDQPVEPVSETDTLDDILSLSCFQDTYGEWMGQSMPDELDPTLNTPRVDVIEVELPQIPVYDDEELRLAFGENPELASLVLDVLAAEQAPKKRRLLFLGRRPK